MMIKIYSLLIIGCFLLSCSTSIEPDTPYEGKKLVLNSLLTTDSPVTMQVTFSEDPNYFATGEKVQDADVQLFENGILVETLLYNQGEYFSPSGYIPKAGFSYFFEVNAPGFETAYSQEVVVPFEITYQVDSIQSFISINKEPALRVFYTIDDTLNTTDFYVLYAKGYLPEKQGYFSVRNFSAAEDKLDAGSNCFYGSYRYKAFNDLCWEGKHQSYIQSELVLSFRDEGRFYFTSVQVSFARVDPAFFNWVKSISMELDGIEYAFLEPGLGYSNVINGYGVVAAANVSVKDIPI